ncbi:MAG: MBL fold metallo-hydrolase [Syntrophomonadaceae bacterium]|nr:MBL fold metallo-hydrolase [Syntrophomonadaceae bacterium]
MVTEVLPGIFQIKVPLPNSPLKELNTYLLKGKDKHLLVDTGFNMERCKQALLAGLREAGAALKDLDFFLTHVHADHSALIYNLVNDESVVYFSAQDAEVLNEAVNPRYSLRIDKILLKNGFQKPLRPLAASQRFFDKNRELNFYLLNDGDNISVGDYNFTCLLTPGHSPGHMCLYEEEKKFILSGDHVLADMTPNITIWLGKKDPLGEYLHSLEQMKKLPVVLALPGHRSLITDFEYRISELQLHHKNRLNEVESILQAGSKTAYEVASFMKWDLKNISWEEFPVMQRRFATLEALAHLEYLFLRQKVDKKKIKETIFYCRC